MAWFGFVAVQQRWCWNHSYPVLSTSELFCTSYFFISTDFDMSLLKCRYLVDGGYIWSVCFPIFKHLPWKVMLKKIRMSSCLANHRLEAIYKTPSVMMMLFLIRRGAFLHWQSAGSRLFMKRELWGLMQRPALDDWYICAVPMSLHVCAIYFITSIGMRVLVCLNPAESAPRVMSYDHLLADCPLHQIQQMFKRRQKVGLLHSHMRILGTFHWLL